MRTLKRLLSALIVIAALVVMTVLLGFNRTYVSLDLYFIGINAPLGVLVSLSLLLGVILGAFLVSLSLLRLTLSNASKEETRRKHGDGKNTKHTDTKHTDAREEQP